MGRTTALDRGPAAKLRQRRSHPGVSVKPPAIQGIIAPLDALRQMLVARCGETVLEFTEKIGDWLWYPETWRIPIWVREAADEMEKLLRKHIREDIRLRGELNNNPPINIDRADCLEGKLDILHQTLTIHRGRTVRTYHNVFCVEDGVTKIVDGISKSRSGNEHQPALKPATDPMVRNIITAVYDDADKGGPRPNINQLPDAVLSRLAAGYTASGRQIKKIGSEPQFKRRRRKPGEKLS